MMTSSDIIAVVAISISGIVSLISAYTSYKNNKANIMARRSELALEKRLTAFVDIVEQMGKLTRALSSFNRVNFENKQELLKFTRGVLDNNKKLLELYIKQRVFYRLKLRKNLKHL